MNYDNSCLKSFYNHFLSKAPPLQAFVINIKNILNSKMNDLQIEVPIAQRMNMDVGDNCGNSTDHIAC